MGGANRMRSIRLSMYLHDKCTPRKLDLQAASVYRFKICVPPTTLANGNPAGGETWKRRFPERCITTCCSDDCGTNSAAGASRRAAHILNGGYPAEACLEKGAAAMFPNIAAATKHVPQMAVPVAET